MVGIAIISFVNYSRGQSRASMAAVMKYTSQDKKTRCDDENLVTGIGCTPRSAYSDFVNTKLLYGKDSGKMFYHMVQSFPVGENVQPKTAHEIAVKLAEHFSGHEVLVCTHLDRDHIHSHFIINSVSFETGKKLHISTPDLEPIRKRSDTLCLENGLSVYKKPEQKKAVKSMSTAEYHTAAKGESWKFRLMNAIDDCMKYASSREDFISLMQSEGFEVKWTDTRKNITYTTPEGKRCCDDKLHDKKYLKDKMIYEFDIRKAALTGGAEAEKHTGFEYSAERGAAGYAQRTQLAGAHGRDTEERRADGTVVGGAEKAADSGGHRETFSLAGGQKQRPSEQSRGECDEVLPTGWEHQREYFLGSKQADAEYGSRAYEDYGQYRFDAEGYSENYTQYAAGAYEQCKAANAEASGSLGRLCDLADSVLQLASVFENVSEAPVYDSTTMRPRVDRKVWLKTRRLKIAHGQNPDDHSEDDFEMRM